MRINNAKTNLLSILVTVLLFQTHSLCGMEFFRKVFSKSKVHQSVESDSQSDDEEGISDDACLICHGRPKNWPHKINLCYGQHGFCTTCIVDWIRTCQGLNNSVTCPICRATITADKQKLIETIAQYSPKKNDKNFLMMQAMQKDFDVAYIMLREKQTTQLDTQYKKNLELQRELNSATNYLKCMGVTLLLCVGCYATGKFINS